MVSFRFNISKLKELQRKIKALDGRRQIPLPELLPGDFIRKYTDFQTLQEMIDASGVKSGEKFGNKEFSKISAHTQFNTLEEMEEAILAEYVKHQLGF